MIEEKMTNEEIIAFIHQIQKDYSKFDLTPDEYQTWYEVLSKTKLSIATGQYESHKQSEYKKNAPKLEIFIYKPKPDVEIDKLIFKCQRCGRLLMYNAMKKHESRHRSVDYIKSRTELYFNTTFSKEREDKLMEMEDREFDSSYDVFLEKLISVTKGAERNNLIKIKYLKDTSGYLKNCDNLENWYQNKMKEMRN